AAWSRRLSVETRSLFLLVRALASSLDEAAEHGGAAVIAATAMGGTFGVGEHGRHGSWLPSQGGVVGFTKCVAIEWPEVRVRALDLDGAEASDALAAHVVNELQSVDAAT